MKLWHPDAFASDFSHVKTDLVNCYDGSIVPNKPMKKFWEGFENFNKRLKDENNEMMLLKLKDWPPREDFSEVLPTRFNDLMNALPRLISKRPTSKFGSGRNREPLTEHAQAAHKILSSILFKIPKGKQTVTL
jgi:hypothetical protein